MRLPGPSCAIIALCENPDEMGTPGFWSRWHWADEMFYFMFNIDSNHGFMVSYDVVKERMLSRLMGWQQMKYDKL
jgi:hypothetical protein